jgi:hypothetical protein
VCGLLGHGEMECGDGVHDDETKQYGNWVMAPVEDWHPQSLGVRFRAPTADGGARSGGRGGGHGRGSRTDVNVRQLNHHQTRVWPEAREMVH